MVISSRPVAGERGGEEHRLLEVILTRPWREGGLAQLHISNILVSVGRLLHRWQ